MADKLAAAVAAAEAPVMPAQIRVRLYTGRDVMIVVPVDLTPLELIDLIGYETRQLPDRLAEARGPRSRILVPSGSMPT